MGRPPLFMTRKAQRELITRYLRMCQRAGFTLEQSACFAGTSERSLASWRDDTQRMRVHNAARVRAALRLLTTSDRIVSLTKRKETA